MKARGQIEKIYTSDTGKTLLIVELAKGVRDLKKYLEVPLDISITKHKERRSLDANAYCWKLISEIAEALNTSKEEIYEEELKRYGYLLLNSVGLPVAITVSKDVDMKYIDGHYKFLKESLDKQYKAYLVIRGSSTYNSLEMSKFIEGVVSDAKELNIETLTPDELKQM